MITQTYSTGQFADKAGVTVRTLRYYDQAGLLKPSSVTEAGHRRYTDNDLIQLQQILALKFLGFSLEQIREITQIESPRLHDSLQIQRQMMIEKREHLDAAIRAIEVLQDVAEQQPEIQWDSVIQVIKVIQMDQTKDWWKKYYTEEQVRKLEERQQHYTEEQQQADQQAWQDLIADMKIVAGRGDDPASPAAQELARRWTGLVDQFTMGDEGIHDSLSKMSWDETPYPRPYTEEEGRFIHRAIEIHRGNDG